MNKDFSTCGYLRDLAAVMEQALQALGYNLKIEDCRQSLCGSIKHSQSEGFRTNLKIAFLQLTEEIVIFQITWGKKVSNYTVDTLALNDPEQLIHDMNRNIFQLPI